MASFSNMPLLEKSTANCNLLRQIHAIPIAEVAPID